MGGTLETASPGGPMPQWAKSGMAIGSIIAASSATLLTVRLTLSSDVPLPMEEQLLYAGGLGIGGAIFLLSLVLGVWNKRN